MAPFRELTAGERNQIIGAKRIGASLPKIARDFGTPLGTVKDTWKLRNKRPETQDDIPRKGRPRKATNEQVARLYRQLRRGPDILWSEITAFFPNKVTQTRARLHEIDPTFHNYQRKKRIDLTQRHADTRLAHANTHVNDPQEQWDHAHWTDECTITEGKGAERRWVFRHAGEGWMPLMMEPVSSSTESISVWGDLHRGKIYIIFLEDIYENTGGRTNQHVYLEVLKAVIENGYYDGDLWVQDNARYHTANTITDWLRDYDVRVHDHPPKSPDLNLIENFWWHLKRRIFELDLGLKTATGNRAARRARMRAAVERVVDEWNNNPQWSLPGKLTQSHKRRLEAVQLARGWQTKY